MSEDSRHSRPGTIAVAIPRNIWLTVLIGLYAAPFGHVVATQSMPAVAILASLVLGITLIRLSLHDLTEMILPNALTYSLIVIGLAFTIWIAPGALIWHAGAAAAGYLFIDLVNRYYRWLRGRDGIGLGDAKLFAAAGAWLGPSGLPSVLLWASAAGLVVALAQHFAGRPVSRHRRLAFGPCLAIGLWLVWLYGSFT